MENREFLQPNVRFGSEIKFRAASWQRDKKYLSWNHWLSTRAGRGSINRDEQTLRYKLFELGHYAGSIILEIGLQPDTCGILPVTAAQLANSSVQYYGIDPDQGALRQAEKKFHRKGLADHAVFFHGSLADFRSAIPIVPTMVLINDVDQAKTLLSQLCFLLADGTPVFMPNWYQNRTDHRLPPLDSNFEFFGRFGESILLRSQAEIFDPPKTFSKKDFALIRSELKQILKLSDTTSPIRSKLQSLATLDQQASSKLVPSDKKWPFVPPPTNNPSTLPDGTPWPRISIVTPTYNQGQYIEETINSVINQGYPNLEYIVVDGASTDETPIILDRYREKIDHLISEPDKGQSDAINKGMKLATGEIVTWLNSDDMLTPGTLFAMAMAFWKSNADMVVGTAQMLNGDKIVREHLTSCGNGPLKLEELLDLDGSWLKGRFFYQPELMFTRDLWERAGGYVDTSLFYSMDHELWLRFAIAGAKMHIIGRPTVLYREHELQKTNSDYRPELREVNQKYIQKYGRPQTPLTTLQSKKYRVTFVNDVGPRFGAGIAHHRMLDSMRAAGHETHFVYALGDGQSKPKNESAIYSEIEATNPDLVVFGNLHGARLGMDLVDQVSQRWASCFVMHDLWLSTGRCCYLGNCEKFKARCDSNCPTATEYPPLPAEQIEPAFEHKLKIISRPKKMVVLANSPWTEQVAKQSAITKTAVIETFKYGFPTHIYKPRDKNLCREILGLPTDAFIVLFASVNVNEERKGSRHLFEALNRLKLPNLLPVCIGHNYSQEDLYPGTVSLGYIEDPAKQAMIFSAADIFVGPSLQEAFGQVFVEAAACGTPSVAYPVGGVNSAINHGVTGRIAVKVHPSALADEILRLYSDGEYRRNLAFWGRIEVENEWSYRSCYHRFNCVLRQFPEYLGFLPPANISFDPAQTEGVKSSSGLGYGLLELASDIATPEFGFAAEETIQLKDGSQRKARWAVGKTCEIRIRVAGSESKSLIATCLNPIAFQTLSVSLNGETTEISGIETKHNFYDPINVCLVPSIPPGEHQVRISFGKTLRERDGDRDLAMLFLDLDLQSSPVRSSVQTSKTA